MAFSKALALKLAAALAAALVLTALGAWLFNRPDQAGKKPARAAATPAKAKDFDALCQGVHHESRRQGKLEWVLDAQQAAYSRARNEARLSSIRMDFFTGQGQKVHLAADQGEINTLTHDARLSGSVLMEYGPYTLAAPQVDYQSEAGRIFCAKPVRLKGSFMEMDADSMSYDVNSQETVLSGKVTGHFFPKEMK